MKIFWAWQSDLKGKISRHFVKDCLELAIAKLNETPEISEAPRDFDGTIERDHDRKDVAGASDLANEILDKIRNAKVFVGDVTPVARTEPLKDKDGKETKPSKAVMNPNVAIELGYALKHLGTKKLLFILNEHYGRREDLPFDLAHKNGPIMYRLGPDAGRATMEAERKKLVASLVSELKLFVEAPVHKPFPEQQFVSSHAFFKPENWDIAVFGEDFDRQAFRIQHDPACYLRVMPMAEPPALFAKANLKDQLQNLGAFGDLFHGLIAQNTEGAAIIGNETGRYVSSYSQAFGTGELWGVNTELLQRGRRYNPHRINQIAIEGLYKQYLSSYLTFMEHVLNIPPPYTVEAGIVSIQGWELYAKQPNGEELRAEMYGDPEPYRSLIKDGSNQAINAFLRSYFESIFKKAGLTRPSGFNGI
jgi:hypothetical protein